MIDYTKLFMKYSIEKDYASALKVFSKLVVQDPDNLLVQFHLANVHSILGNKSKLAIEILNKVLKKDPSFESARFNRAICLFKIKKYKESIADLNKILKTNQNYDIYHQRALCFEKMKDSKKAIKDLKTSLYLLEQQSIR